MGYNNFKVFPLQSPPLIPLDRATGFNIAMNSFSFSCSSMALSIGHNLLGVYLLQCGLIWGPQSLQGCTCCVVNLSMGTDASRCYLLWRALIQSHRYFEMYLLQHGLFLGTQSLQDCICPDVDLAMTTDALGCPAPRWICSRITGPSAQVHTGVPACPVQQ